MLSIPIIVKGQLLESIKASGKDSITFIETYGSLNEYNFQEYQKFNSHHKRKVFLIGGKFIWAYELAMYAAENTEHHNVEYDVVDDKVVFDITGGVCIGCKSVPYVIVTASFDKDGRIKAATVSGDDTRAIIKMFVYYWNSEIKIEKLKKGVVIYKDFASDRVTFKWTNIYPVITITKNPNVGIVIPKL